MVTSKKQLSGVAPRILIHRHLQIGWWSLLGFLTLGVLLESLHGLKVEWYINPAFATRRLMWTLGHAHGALLGLIHLGFAASVFAVGGEVWKRSWASPCLTVASLLVPGGFLLGGIFIYDGDPGIGIMLVPIGAISLFAGGLATALSVAPSNQTPEPGGERKRVRPTPPSK